MAGFLQLGMEMVTLQPSGGPEACSTVMSSGQRLRTTAPRFQQSMAFRMQHESLFLSTSTLSAN